MHVQAGAHPHLGCTLQVLELYECKAHCAGWVAAYATVHDGATVAEKCS
jgi:hypothetical protein